MSSPVNRSTSCSFSRLLASDKGGGGAGSTASTAAACEQTLRRATLPLIKDGLTAADCQSPRRIPLQLRVGPQHRYTYCICSSLSTESSVDNVGAALVVLQLKPCQDWPMVSKDRDVCAGGSGHILRWPEPCRTPRPPMPCLARTWRATTPSHSLSTGTTRRTAGNIYGIPLCEPILGRACRTSVGARADGTILP